MYERTLEALLEDLGADVPLERIRRARLEAHLRGRYGHCAPATFNRHLATIGSLFAGFGQQPDQDDRYRVQFAEQVVPASASRPEPRGRLW